MRSRRRRRIPLTFVVTIAMLGISSASESAAQQPAGEPKAPPGGLSWLNLGDSFGAGEGATGASGFCQRSPNAGGPKAANILRQERGWRIDAEAFAACTAYLGADLLSSRDELQADAVRVFDGSPLPELAPPDAEITNADSLYDWALRQAPGRKFDVIVASLGGNDVGFGDIVKGCIDVKRIVAGLAADAATAPVAAHAGPMWAGFARGVAQAAIDTKDPVGCGPVVREFDQRIERLFTGEPYPTSADSPRSGARGSLVDSYRAVADATLADDGVFVILGYPRLVTPSSTWGRWRGGRCNMLSAADADALGAGAERFDERMRAAVEGLGDRFEYVSRLEIFDDGGDHRSLCGRGVEWLNTPLVFLRDGTTRPERGFHPNDLGYLATAEAVAGVVESRLGIRPPSPTTSPAPTAPAPRPTVRSSEPHWDIGERFEGTCSIAWPTAPSRGRNSIMMRTTCPGVPAQFLFVDIAYGDPDLPVTPGRSKMRVRGEIVDIVRSEFGFTTLEVVADHIEVL